MSRHVSEPPHKRPRVEPAFSKVSNEGGSKIFRCGQCSLVFTRLRSIKAHIKTHAPSQLYRCTLCEEDFHCARLFIEHRRNVHLTTDFSCGICEKEFANNKLLRQHTSTHSQGAFECKECFAKFTTKQNLRYHILIHSGEKPFQCSLCKVSFRRGDALRAHGRSDLHLRRAQRDLQAIIEDPKVLKREDAEPDVVEIVEKFFPCGKCGKRFTQNILLEKHKLIHSARKNSFACRYCNKRFPVFVYLSRHLATHDKAFSCPDCNASFATQKALDVHLRSIHLHVYPFTCDICHACFAAKETLARHKHTHEAPKFQCQGCLKMWMRRDNLERHCAACPAVMREAASRPRATMADPPALEQFHSELQA